MPQRLDEFLSDAPAAPAPVQGPTQGPMRLDQYLSGGTATAMQPATAAPAQPVRQHGAIGNMLTAAMHAYEPVSNAVIRTAGRAGLISPERAQAAIQNQLFYPDENTVSARIGGAVGGASQMAAGAYAPALYGIGAAENAKERQEQRMANGEQISGWQQAGDVAAQAAIGYGFGKLAPGGRISKALLGNVPGGVAGRLIGASAVGAGENAVQQVAGNASAKYIGGEANRDLSEGTGEAAGVGAFFGAAGQGGHEVTHNILQAMRERQSAGAPPTPPVSDFNQQLQQHGSSPEVTVNLKGGGHEPQSAQPAQAGLEQTPHRAGQSEPTAHLSENRLPGAETEGSAKTQPDNESLTGGAVPAHGGETTGERRVMESMGRRADEVAESTGPLSAADRKVYDAMDRAEARQGETPAPPPGQDQPMSGEQRVMESMGRRADEAAASTGPLSAADQRVYDAMDRAEAHRVNNPDEDNSMKLRPAERLRDQKPAPAPAEQTPIQKLLAKGRQAAEPTENAKPEFGSPEWADSMKRATEEFKNRKSPTMRKGMVSLPESKFAERDVQPALASAADAAKKSWGAVNRFLGTGASWSIKDRDSANHISASLAEHDRSMAQVEHELAPHREAMQNWSDKSKAQWVDAVEGSGISPDPKHQAAADFNNQLNEQNIKEGKLYGLNTKKWEGDYIGRLAEFPESKEGAGTGRSTIAGPQNFLKGRVFDTFSEFKKFVEDHGGKLKYDNPMDMLLAKQTEIQRSITARKTMYTEDNHGQLKWVPNGEASPEGFDTKLKDPLAQQERRQILPKEMVARLAQMDHFAAKNFLEGPQVQKAAQYLRPGTDLPKDWSYSGEKQTGTYHANDNVADIFNNLISPGLKKNVPILHQASSIMGTAAKTVLSMSPVHYAIESYRNARLALGRSMEAAFGAKDLGLAAKNLYLGANPLAARKLGMQAIEQYKNPGAHPELEHLIQGSIEGGAKFKMHSVLDQNHFADMKKEWAEGNHTGAGLRLLNGIQGKMHDVLFKQYVAPLKAAADVMAASNAEAKGLTGEAKQRYMSLAHDTVENALGMVQGDRQFKNRLVSDSQNLLFLAPGFKEGVVRGVGAAVRDTTQQAHQGVTQKTWKALTPAQYQAAAAVTMHATLAALTQIAYTAATTGKPIMPTASDLLKPRTGRKDDQGREERLTLPTDLNVAAGLASKPGQSIKNSLNPVYGAIGNDVSNVDENNVEIRHKGDSFLKQMRDSVVYAGEKLSPLSARTFAQQVTGSERPGQPHTLDTRLGEYAGVHTSYTASSDAEQEARQALFEKGRANPMTQEQYDRQQERGKIREEFTGKNPQASSDLASDLKSGKLAQSDRVALMKQQKEPGGLPGELKKMQAEQIMDRVWPKMTADEKQKNQWLVRGMVGRSTTLTGAQKQQLWGTIKKDVGGK